jgi:MFS family permease
MRAMADRTEEQPATGLSQGEAPSRLWTWEFLKVCMGGFLSTSTRIPLFPVIPLFIVDLGGNASTVGLSIAAFSVTSSLLRPLTGQMTDHWSAKGTFALGCLLMGLGGLLLLIPSIWMVILSQLIQGFAWGCVNTGGSTVVANMAPRERRGAALGYYNMARGALGFYLPWLAIELIGVGSFDHGYWLPFLLFGLAGLIGAPVTYSIRETTRPRPKPRQAGSEGLIASLFEPGSYLSSTLLFMVQVAQPATTTFIVLFAADIGVGKSDIALLFLVQGALGVLSQAALANLPDRIGRGPTIALGLTGTVLSLVVLSQANSLAALMLGMGLSRTIGSVTPTALQALAVDRSPPERLGAAMATYSLSFQLGSFAGGLIGGYIVDWFDYRPFFLASAIPSACALVLLFAKRNTIRLPPRAPAPKPGLA